MRSILLRLTLAKRLMLGFGGLLLMLLAVAGSSVLALRAQGARVDDIVEGKNAKLALAYGLLESINSMGIQTRTATLVVDLESVKKELSVLADAKRRYAEKETALRARVGASDDSTEKALFAQIMDSGKAAIPLLDKAAKEGEEGATLEATATLVMKVRPVELVWRQKVAELIALIERQNKLAAQEVRTAQHRALALASALSVLAIALGIGVAWRTTRSVTVPVSRAVRVAECIAEGDLTSEIETGSHDEIGRLLQAIKLMQDRLRALVGNIRDSAQSIELASSEVAMGNQDLAHRTEQTAANLQQTASSMSELTVTVNHSAEAAVLANETAGSALETARRGGEVVANVVSTMATINQSSQRIADIIGVIDDIAFQTNILALNAAVEAASAGEQGRGFAVVAGEVRTLAHRCAAAAKEIRALIGSSVESVVAGSRLVADAGSTMDEIVASVQRVSEIMAGISGVVGQQSAGIRQVSGSIDQLDEATQQNAALVEQSAAAAESLKAQSTKLAELVSVFRLGSIDAS